MGLAEDIATIRRDLPGNSQKVAIFFFKQYPHQQDRFPNYKGKNTDDLPGVAAFGPHVGKVVKMLLETLEVSGDAGKLKGKCTYVAKMPQHSNLSIKDYEEVCTALLAFGESAMPGFDKGAMEGATSKFLAALKAEM